jgi:hypothetical protein
LQIKPLTRQGDEDKIRYFYRKGKENVFSKFRICVGKFHIEGPHRKIQRYGRVCINNID